MKVCQITTTHIPFDTRIYQKYCESLALHYEVILLNTKGENKELKNLKIISSKNQSRSRFVQIITNPIRLYKLALKSKADIFHFHDPDFLPYGYLLKCKGKVVIYDVHEDYPKDIFYKPWIPKVFRKLFSILFSTIENFVAKRLDYVITATPTIANRFRTINGKTTDIKNYPIINNLLIEEARKPASQQKENFIAYIGAISKERGIVEMLDSLPENVTLILAGKFATEELFQEIQQHKNWSQVKFLGFIDSDKRKEVLEKSIMGLLLLHPTPTFVDAIPVKLFEYMEAGIPVIASDFELLKEILEPAKCGFCISPFNTAEIKLRIAELVTNSELANRMGENGRNSVLMNYSWEKEKQKLLAIYNGLLNV